MMEFDVIIIIIFAALGWGIAIFMSVKYFNSSRKYKRSKFRTKSYILFIDETSSQVFNIWHIRGEINKHYDNYIKLSVKKNQDEILDEIIQIHGKVNNYLGNLASIISSYNQELHLASIGCSDNVLKLINEINKSKTDFEEILEDLVNGGRTHKYTFMKIPILLGFLGSLDLREKNGRLMDLMLEEIKEYK